MKKLLVVQYETSDVENGINRLIVADPYKKLPNGNNEVIKVLIGDYADEVFKQLTEG